MRDPFGPGSPFAGFGGFRAGSGGSATGPGGVRFEFRTSGDPGAFSDFFHMMFGDEGRAAGEPERFSSTSNESMDELLRRLGMAGTGPAAGAGTRTGGQRGQVDPGAVRDAPGRRTTFADARHQPIEVTAELSLEESYHGSSRIVELDGRRLEVTIPRGVDTGSRIRLSGKGPEGRDLIVVTKLKPHKTFTRDGDDLELEVPVTLREALLGSEIPVGTLKGRVLLKVPAGTQHGKTFRLKGQGMPRFKGEGTGDLFVRARVVLPTNLTDDAKAAATTFLDIVDQPDPRA